MEQNYLPLFRKYRPQSFKDIVGQESLVKALSNAIELNRIANAYLFCGPRGTGKTSSARIFAKSLNCEHGPTLEPCQKCASCVDITNATGLDVIEIDAASNRGIQDAKELISQVQYAPINGKYKIFIIDEVHALTNDAFNALLKTFEEPPKNVIFILATTEPHKVLETIVSRCQRFDLKRITIEDIIKRLREISDLEKIKITDEALFTIAKNVSGGLRDSLALLDQVSILGVKEEIDKAMIEELLGKINFDLLFNLLNDINNQNIEASINDVETIYSKGNEPRNLAENFIEFLRNVILILNSDNDELISKCTTLIKNDIDKVRTSNFDKDKTVRILNTMIEYYKEIKVSTNPYLWMELAVIGACKSDLKSVTSNVQPAIQKPVLKQEVKPEVKPEIKQEVKADEPVQPETTVNTIEAQHEPAPVQQTQQPETVINTDKLDKMDGAEIWANVLQAISLKPVRSYFEQLARLVKVENKKIVLGFLNENNLISAKSDSKAKYLETAMKAICPDYGYEFIKIDSKTKTIAINLPKKPANFTPAQTNPVSAKPPQVQEQAQTENTSEEDENKRPEKTQYNEQVQNMVEQFGGRIIE